MKTCTQIMEQPEDVAVVMHDNVNTNHGTDRGRGRGRGRRKRIR